MTSIAETATAATDTNRAVARLNADSLSWTIVRVATGAMLMPHGAQKLFGWYSASTPTRSAAPRCSSTAASCTCSRFRTDPHSADPGKHPEEDHGQ